MNALHALVLALMLVGSAVAAPLEELLRAARAAEEAGDSARALELYRQAESLAPGDATILQRIARQYSDLVLDQTTDEERRRHARAALAYAERAVALAPQDPVNVLSLAISHGKLATYSDTRTKVNYAHRVKAEAERALQLDPHYAWAHHILGRWHREVAALGAAARGWAWLFHGGLPKASTAEAVRHLRLAVALEPDELKHHLELGFALAADGSPAEARAEWARGLGMPSRGKHDDAAKQAARRALQAER